MLPLDSDRWSQLEHCCGSAKAVPKLLSQLESDDPCALSELWDMLCHQYSVYSATFAAIPHVVRIAPELSTELRDQCLMFVGSVAIWAEPYDLAGIDSDVLDAYHQALKTAAQLSVEVAKDSEHDYITFIYVLRAVAALRGCVGPGKRLSGLIDEEFIALCPNCDRELYVWPSEDGMTAAAEDPVTHPATLRTPVVPRVGDLPKWDEESFNCNNSFVWLCHLAQRAGHTKVVTQLRSLYGRAECPACNTRFDLMRQITEAA